METDAKLLDRIVYKHIMEHPHDRLFVFFSRYRQRQIEQLRKFRFAVHGRVLDLYEREKPYLSPQDLWTLYMANKLSNNNDVFAVFKHDPEFTWNDQTVDRIERDLLTTIQITYFGDEDYFEPTLRGLMRVAGDSTPFYNDRFPFEHRLSDEDIAEFRKTLFATHDPRTTCEVTRYGKFVNNLAVEVTDRLILETLKRIKKRGMKTILVAADELTIRLFRRYGIRPYADLPTGSGKREILGILEVDSEMFREVFARLSESSARIKTKKVVHRDSHPSENSLRLKVKMKKVIYD